METRGKTICVNAVLCNMFDCIGNNMGLLVKERFNHRNNEVYMVQPFLQCND